VSVTATFCASEGPSLTTSICQVMSWPAIWRLPALLPMPTTRLSTRTSAAVALSFTPVPRLVQSLPVLASGSAPSVGAAAGSATFTHMLLTTWPPPGGSAGMVAFTMM
jgi:hypothetical protein